MMGWQGGGTTMLLLMVRFVASIDFNGGAYSTWFPLSILCWQGILMLFHSFDVKRNFGWSCHILIGFSNISDFPRFHFLVSKIQMGMTERLTNDHLAMTKRPHVPRRPCYSGSGPNPGSKTIIKNILLNVTFVMTPLILLHKRRPTFRTL